MDSIENDKKAKEEMMREMLKDIGMAALMEDICDKLIRAGWRKVGK